MKITMLNYCFFNTLNYFFENTIEALKKEAEIWHEMTVIEEMMPVYLEYGLK